MAKTTRGKYRYGDKGAVPTRKSLHKLGDRILGYIEFTAARHSVKQGAGNFDRDEIQIDSSGLYLAGVQGLHAVVQRTGK